MSLASTTDIAARRGVASLTTQQTATATLLLAMADSIIADAAGVAVASLNATTTPILRFVAIEAVCRAMDNPTSAAQTREQLGQYSYSASYRDGDSGGGIWLTDREARMVRRAVHGSLTASPRVGSIATDITGGPSVFGS